MAGIPRISVSYAQSLDGRIATQSGESQWISGGSTLHFAHRLRKRNRGILVGVGTVLKDNPKLTCRIPHRTDPVRIVLDSQLSIPPESVLVQSAHTYETFIITTEGVQNEKRELLKHAGVEVMNARRTIDGHIDLKAALQLLLARGIDSILVEGGSRVITSFLKERLVSKIFITMAPIIIGQGIPAVGDLGVHSLREVITPLRIKTKKMGKDLVWELDLETSTR